jgi:hypothetical protein
MTDLRHHVIVIGDGVVVLGVALEITRRIPSQRLLVLEKKDRVARHLPFALFTEQKKSSDDRPQDALKIPAPKGRNLTLTENAASPFHAEPTQFRVRKTVPHSGAAWELKVQHSLSLRFQCSGALRRMSKREARVPELRCRHVRLYSRRDIFLVRWGWLPKETKYYVGEGVGDSLRFRHNGSCNYRFSQQRTYWNHLCGKA